MEEHRGEIIISDELLDKLGDFYNSDFVKHHMTYVRELTFYEWLEKEYKDHLNIINTSMKHVRDVN